MFRRTTMKRLIIACICSIALAMGLFAQAPATSPTPSAAATAPVTASVSPSDLADRIQQKLEKKFRGHHGIVIDGSDRDEDADLRKMREFVAIPIVAIVFLSIFGAPVLIVIMIGVFALLISRTRQRTIRMMVEKGQPVPAELLAPTKRALRQLTGSDIGLADDLAQETFLRAYKNLRNFRGEARFSTWLYRIAYNCFREHARKRKELVGIDEEQLEREHDPQTVDPALRHDLMHALSLLPLHERTAVVLCCQNGLSHDEAARVLDIPLGTVKTNVLRGREKLKRTLAEWGPN